MAVNGYTTEKFEQLVREVRGAPRVAVGAKRLHDESHSEVLMICSPKTWLPGNSSYRTNRTNRRVSSGRSGGQVVRGLIFVGPGPSLVYQVSLTALAPLALSTDFGTGHDIATSDSATTSK